MPPRVRQVLDQNGLYALLQGPRGATAKALLARGLAVEGVAKERLTSAGRVDQGTLRASIHTHMVRLGGILICEVGTDVEYAIYVHEGTGLYGPRHALIYPKRARVLVFTPRKSGGQFIKRADRTTVFVKFTRGMPGTPFLRDALRIVLR